MSVKNINLNIQTTNKSEISEQASNHPIYRPLKKVGQGSFGKAYLVQSEHDHKQYILKKIRIDSQNSQTKQAIFQEVKLMQNLNHTYIIKYLESFIQDKCVCLVMEYAQKGDLEKYLEKRKIQNNPLKQEQIISWFIQICLGLKYIHERKILHRDLKADNIFITSEEELKIGDFGVSKVMNETYDLAKTKIGTPHIMAPQIFQNMKYNQKSDMWSLGCLLYKLQMLKYPFQSANILAMMAKMENKKYEPIQGDYSQDLKQLTYSLLSFQPKQRPTVHKILQIPFIKRNLSQVLQDSIHKYSKTQNTLNSSKKLLYSNGDESMKKITRKSIHSLSSSILTPLSKKNQQSLTSALLPLNSSNIPISNLQNYKKNQNLKMIEYKQNYPILLQQNKQIKQENNKLLKQLSQFQQSSEKLLEKFQENIKELSKQEIIQSFRAHILNFVYK